MRQKKRPRRAFVTDGRDEADQPRLVIAASVTVMKVSAEEPVVAAEKPWR